MLAHSTEAMLEPFTVLGTAPALVLDNALNYRSGQAWTAEGEACVLIENHFLGICRSDAKEASRSRQGPSQFGHELVGRMVHASPTTRIQPGQFVCVDPNIALSRSSGYCGYFAMSGSAAAIDAALYHLPIAAASAEFVYVEPLACALHAVGMAQRAMRSALESEVLILGAGSAGLLIALCFLEAGVARPKVAVRGADRWKWAEQSGLAHYVEFVDMENIAASFDAVVIATSFIDDSLLRLAMRRLKPDGAAILYGGTATGQVSEDVGADLDGIRRREQIVRVDYLGRSLSLVGSYGTSPDAFHKAIALIAESQRVRRFVNQLTRGLVALPEAAEVICAMLTSSSPGKSIVYFTHESQA